MKKSWSTNPGARISRSMYHEGNPGARILGEYASWRKSWSTNPGGVCIMKEILEHESWGSMYHEGSPGARILEHEFLMKEFLGHNFLTSMFLVFFSKKLEHGVCIMNRKSSKTQWQIVVCTIPQDFPSPGCFLKKRWKREKKQSCLEHECPWRTNFPGERILGKPPRKNCGEKTSGKSWWEPPLENPNLFLCTRKILARKPPGKSQFVSIMCWKNSGEKTPSENSGKQTSAICSLPRIVSVKLVVIGMVLKPVHKWSWGCQFMLILLNPPNWFESCLIFKSNGKRYPLIVDNLYFVQNDKIAELENE